MVNSQQQILENADVIWAAIRAEAARDADAEPILEATGKVAGIFAEIKQTKGIGFVPNFWRTIATNPDLLEIVWTSLKRLMHPEAAGRPAKLDPATREIIALAVSATNNCAYCINSHTAALRKLGMDEETLGDVLAIVGLFNQTNALANAYQVEPDVLPPVD